MADTVTVAFYSKGASFEIRRYYVNQAELEVT